MNINGAWNNLFVKVHRSSGLFKFLKLNKRYLDLLITRIFFQYDSIVYVIAIIIEKVISSIQCEPV